MKNKALSMFFIFLSFVALATVASAGKETQLTHDERLTIRTAIYGNHVFWTEITANYVHAFDLTTGERKDIDGNGMYGSLVVNAYGNKVVWTGDDGGGVYMYDISTGNGTKVASGSLPDIYGNYIVYTKGDGIYLHDLNGHKETKIDNSSSSPAIYDTKVVWSQANSNNNGYDIREYNISTNKTNTITTTNSSIPESELDIYGNIVVWIESGNVYMYNVASHEKIQVTNSGNTSQPVIYGNRIIYTICDRGDLYTPGHTDIYIYEISTSSTTRITTSTCAFAPSIYGDKIVYADSRVYPVTGEIRDIYLYDLHPENEKLKAVFTTTATSGEVPLTVSFSDISSGMPNSWYWDFGDGSNSTQQNASHTYSSIGNYTVCLKVSGANGTDSKTVTINVLRPELIVNFSTNVSKGYVPLTVQFKDLSENARTWYWVFGDNDNASSFQQNPMHTYYSAGNYTVRLIISGLHGTNGTSSTITVLENSSPSSGSSSSGGDTDGSPELY